MTMFKQIIVILMMDFFFFFIIIGKYVRLYSTESHLNSIGGDVDKIGYFDVNLFSY